MIARRQASSVWAYLVKKTSPVIFARPLALQHCRCYSARNDFFEVSEEVRDALNSGKPVVALETTIYTHGVLTP